MTPTRKPYFTSYDTNNHEPWECDRFCKVHNYYDFYTQRHEPLPHTWNFHSSRHGWRHVAVFTGPPGYFPKKPTNDQMTNMSAYCPHTQGELTCNTCLRHTFRPYEV